ncbi:MAG: flagellar basal body P-ring protein FlgI [Deltaproteobacteria bacterium]|nr:flagellar basal body P-ring protein FlgI [Deltaproteobacteria bacterium]
MKTTDHRKLFQLLVLMLLTTIITAAPGWGARLKDIGSFKGIRSNQLVGYGLVVGLNGTGDSSNNVDFAVRSTLNMLERMGIHVERERFANIKLKNVAAVMVTANLPPFARTGNKIDVTISSIGDAKSLLGGTLLMTPLKGVDDQVYALGQGPIAVGGFTAGGNAGGGITKNHPTVGTISKGAIIEKEIPLRLENKKELTLALFNSDFTTADLVKSAINRFAGREAALSVDSGTILVAVPEKFQQNPAAWIAAIERLEVTPDAVARVILNERTGTVVLGENVRISTVAVAHGNLSIQIKENLNVSQPLPFAPGAAPGSAAGGTALAPGAAPRAGTGRPGSGNRPATGPLAVPGGATVVTPDTDVAAQEEGNKLMVVPQGVSLGEVVQALNAIGVTPRDLISILQAIKASGAMQDDLEII